MTPLDYYIKQYLNINQPRKEIYIGGPITSGSAVRLLGKSDLVKDRETAINININIGKKIVDLVKKEFDADYYIYSPFSISAKNFTDVNWTQFDFSLYYMFYLSGIDIQKAKKFWKKISANFDKESYNVLKNKEKRRSKNLILAKEFFKFINEEKTNYNMISKIVMLPDHMCSPGCTLEKELGKLFNVEIDEVYFDKKDPEFNNSVLNNKYWNCIKDKDFHLPVFNGDGNKLIHIRKINL